MSIWCGCWNLKEFLTSSKLHFTVFSSASATKWIESGTCISWWSVTMCTEAQMQIIINKITLMKDSAALVFTRGAWHGQTPVCTSDPLHPYITSRSLSCSDRAYWFSLALDWKQKGDRVFEVAAPALWFALSADSRSVVSVDAFKKQLKAHSFKVASVASRVVGCCVRF